MLLAPCRPFQPTPPPLPPLPLQFDRTPLPENYLLDVMTAGFPPGPVLTPPHIQKICRSNLPGMLGNFFPHGETPLVNNIAAYRSLLFALRVSGDALPTDPVLQPFLQQFCHTLEQAGILAVWLASGPAAADAAFCDSWLLPQLQARTPVLLEGGYESPLGGHAAAVYLCPAGTEQTLCVVADRMAGEPHHPEDRPQHPVPLVYRFATANLTGPAGVAFFCSLMALQRLDAQHTLEQFYAAIDQGVAQCQGVQEVGWRADGSLQQNLRVGGQSALKANTCTVSSAFTVLHFALHAAFDTLDPGADPERRIAVQTLYKQLKDQCRARVLEQFVAALKQVRQTGDAAEIVAYEAALQRTRAYVQARAASHPNMLGHLAALKMV